MIPSTVGLLLFTEAGTVRILPVTVHYILPVTVTVQYTLKSSKHATVEISFQLKTQAR